MSTCSGAERGASALPRGGGGELTVEVRPRSPYRLPRGSDDRTLRIRGGVATRLLHVEGAPVLARAWQRRDGALVVRAEAVEPELVRRHRAEGGGLVRAPGRLAAGRRGDAGGERPPAGWRQGDPGSEREPAGEDELAVAIERMRFVLGVDYDLGEFHRRFRRDPLVGPLIRRMPSFRPRRRVWPWEALAAAVVGQLIEAQRAVGIERRIVGRWGPRLGEGAAELRDVPGAATIAGRAPAELEAMDLSPNRALALWRVAKAVSAGRCPIEGEAADRRLLAMPQIGPWTVQCLQLFGRGEMDALPAGDLGYIKLVGRLAGLGRRATVPEVEEFYAPYEPFRGLVGSLTLAGLHRKIAQGPPLRLAA